MTSPVVSYGLDDETNVHIEIDPAEGWLEVSSDHVLGQIKKAVEPAVLEKVREAKPDEVQVKFGIKVSGETHWLIGRASLAG